MVQLALVPVRDLQRLGEGRQDGFAVGAVGVGEGAQDRQFRQRAGPVQVGDGGSLREVQYPGPQDPALMTAFDGFAAPGGRSLVRAQDEERDRALAAGAECGQVDRPAEALALVRFALDLYDDREVWATGVA